MLQEPLLVALAFNRTLQLARSPRDVPAFLATIGVSFRCYLGNVDLKSLVMGEWTASMLIVKSILGLVIGTAAGLLGGFILGFVVRIFVGIAWSDFRAGDVAAGAVFVLAIVVGAIGGLVTPYRMELRKHRERDAERRSYETHLDELVSKTHKEFSFLLGSVFQAGYYLDRAAKEFEERAFVPFWDEIEQATNKLAMYQHSIDLIRSYAVEHKRVAQKLPQASSTFALPAAQLPDPSPAVARLVEIVRKAQKDYQFASIYEQRKTNKILVEGFGTLGTAIFSLGDAIAYSITELATNLRVSADDLLSEAMSSRKAMAADADERRRAERDALEEDKKQTDMLDNIQRGRKPWP